MSTGPQPKPLSDDELLFRRIPKSTEWYHPGEDVLVDEQAFRPSDSDTTGLSLERARSTENPEFMSAEQMATGSNPSGYVIAVLSVRDLLANGVAIEPRIEGAGPGHVELPELTRNSRSTSRGKELKRILSRAVIRVEDPGSHAAAAC